VRWCRTGLLFAVAGTASSLCGCTPSEILGKTFVMYPGEKRPASELAVVTCDDMSRAVILKVDDRPDSFVNCERIGGLSFGATGAKIHLLPGKHTLRVRFYVEGYEYTGTGQRKKYLYAKEGRDLELKAEAGATYYLQATQTERDWTATLEKREQPKKE